MEDTTRLAFQTGGPTFMLNWPYVYPSAKSEVPEIFENMGIARYPAIDASEPSHVTLGGINLGVSTYSDYPEQAMDAAKCLRGEQNQIIAAAEGRPAADDRGGLRRAGDQEGLSGLLRPDEGDDRRRRAAPGQPGLQRRLAGDPAARCTRRSAIDPQQTIEKMADKVKVVAEGGIY